MTVDNLSNLLSTNRKRSNTSVGTWNDVIKFPKLKKARINSKIEFDIH